MESKQKTKFKTNKMVYQIIVEDLQTVAHDLIGRDLIDKEVEAVSDKLGDFIDWYASIENSINYLEIS